MSNTINILGIDEDFVDIINELVNNGFKPWSSCDGVASHHTPEMQREGLTAYISFLNSDKILELLSAFKKDEYFEIGINNQNSKYPREMYENTIEGNCYSVYFENLEGEYTKYFNKIINYVITHDKLPIDENIQNISNKLNLTESSQIAFYFKINAVHPACYNEETKTKINSLCISSKEGYDMVPNINEIINRIREKYNIAESNSPNKEDKTFVFLNDTIYSDDINLLQEIMDYCLEIELAVSKKEVLDYDDASYDKIYKEYEEYMKMYKDYNSDDHDYI